MANQETLPLTESERQRFFYGYVVVVAGFCGILIMFGAFYTFGVFFKPLLTEFGWTRAATSGAFSLYMALHGFLAIVAGRLNDRFGPRLVITGCGIILGLGYILMSQISAIWQLYLFYGVILALAMSGSFVPIVSTVARWFVKRRGLMTGIVVAGVGVGAMIMPPIASRLIIAYHWRLSYIIVGLAAMVVTILAAQFLRHDPAKMGQLPYGADEAKVEGLTLETAGVSFWEAIRTRQFWLLCLVLASCFFSVGVILVHIVAHATDLGISETSAANILSSIGGLSIAGRVTMGIIADRISNKQALAIVCIGTAVPLFFLAGARELWLLCLLGAIFGFAYGGLVSLQSPIVAGLFGLSSHGMILGGTSFIATLGCAIGPVVAGSIFDATGSYSSAFLVCAIASIIGLILVSLLKPSTR